MAKTDIKSCSLYDLGPKRNMIRILFIIFNSFQLAQNYVTFCFLIGVVRRYVLKIAVLGITLMLCM